MIPWRKRAPETAYLLNPAFCAAVIYNVIFEYQKTARKSFPYVLVYLVLPMILHKSTRERISSRTNMVVWIQKNPDVLVGYSQRTKSLVPFANEAVEFLLNQRVIELNQAGINIIKTISKVRMESTSDTEILECYQKAAHVARWFVRMVTEESIYAAWGVRP